EAIAPQSWKTGAAPITISAEKLTITQSRSIHEQIQALLDQLESPKPHEFAEWQRNFDVLRRLEKRIPEVSFQRTPFDEMLDWVNQPTNLNVHIEWRRMVGLGIERDKAVTLLMKDQTARQILGGLLRETGGDDVKLGYAIYDGVLRITTAAELPRFF